MKITIIYGQNHKGSTYHMTRMLADKIGGEITEFFCQEISAQIVLDVLIASLNQKNYVHTDRNYFLSYSLWMKRT